MFVRFPVQPSSWQGYLRKLLMHMGIDVYLDMPDRLSLETIIIPYLITQKDIRRILFIGCDWYTKGYNSLFKHLEYHTIDKDPDKKQFGAKNHIVDGCESISNYFAPASLDLVICNGVYGYGLNDPDAFERTVRGINNSLREGGILIFGWDDKPNRTPFPLGTSAALGTFERYVFPPFAADTYRSSDQASHIFSFYRKQ